MDIQKHFIACSAQLANLGGNCLVAEVPIMFGGDLKLVTITDDCIVGRRNETADYSSRIDELFVAESWLELCKIVGCGPAVRIYNKFKERWHADEHFPDEAKMKAVKRLIEFTDAAAVLSDCWHDDVLSDAAYPFDESFEDVQYKIFCWQQNILSKIESK